MTQNGISPTRLIDGRIIQAGGLVNFQVKYHGKPTKSYLIPHTSKCYKQLAELKNLKDSGVLLEEEYAAEREAILNVLKKLGNIHA